MKFQAGVNTIWKLEWRVRQQTSKAVQEDQCGRTCDCDPTWRWHDVTQARSTNPQNK